MTATLNRKPVFDAVRRVLGRGFKQAEVVIIDDAIDKMMGLAPSGNVPSPSEPRWLRIARAKIGQREIPGPRHNPWIAKGWAKLGASWFNDDETPWCGFFVAFCIEGAGLAFPKLFMRAKEWAKWGVPCEPMVGAVVVFSRKGGGHVGFLVGESTANWYVLGGNQSNEVNITPIAKTRVVLGGIRWPSGKPLGNRPLPQMSGGTVSRNEA